MSTGHKKWATGDLVEATAFNSYVQNQIVGVYDDSSARDAAFGGTGEPTLAEGMVCYLKDTNELQIYSGSAWAALLDVDTISVSSGKYTVGANTSAVYTFEVHSDDDLTVFKSTTKGAMRIANSQYDANDYTSLDFGYTGSDNPIGRIATRVGGGGSELWFGTSDNYSNGITNDSVRITSDGYLQVGDGSTDYTLDSSFNNPLRFNFNGYTGGVGGAGSGAGMWIGHNSAARTMALATNETERLVVGGSGKVCIRDDAQPAVIGARLLTLRSQTSGMIPLLAWAEQDVGAATVIASIFMIGDTGDSTNPDTGDYWALFRRGNGSTIGSIRGTGSASVNFSTTSDQTLKNDLGDAGDVSAIIDAIKVHKFTWKEADDHVGEQIGVFAQEVLDVNGIPYGIASPAETRNEVVDITTDEDGNEVETTEDVYYPASIDYGKLVPLLVQEIKSLRTRVADLEGE